MDYIQKTLHCTKINGPVNVKYFIGEMDEYAGRKKKMITFYECASKNVCRRDYDLRNCTCFFEMKNVERELLVKA